MRHQAELVFTYADPEQASGIHASIRPEIDDIDGDRTRATVEQDACTITVTISATDLVGLRAGVNTWSQLITVGERVTAC